ncbi:MAG TPA: penicillin-binding transpeptidase domain-containing protein [Blastocatellia bacterium]|nr:penicillin-binding transpeptidase domain-containing protein [Blastocatellia bacterium]
MRIIHHAKSLIASSTGRSFALICIATSLLLSAACTGGYRPPIASRPVASETELSDMAYEALNNRVGTIIVVDPRYGRVLKRVSHGFDVQFTSSPFELAQIVTAYAALDAGIINDRTLLPCAEAGRNVDVVEALSQSCPAFFAELSKRLTRAQFARAAGVIGFTYYGIESPTADQTWVRPIPAKIQDGASAESFAALAVRGEGLQARELHLAQLASSLASGTTASERFAAYIMVNTKTSAPPVVSINRTALGVVRRGLLKAVDEGEAKAAAHIDQKVAGKIGGGLKGAGGKGDAIFVSYAPANDPQVALVVYLKDALGRDAAEVAGKFYEYWFRQKQ